MKTEVLALVVLATAFARPDVIMAQNAALPRSTPETQGVSSAAVREYIETADREVISMHSFMLVRHGHVVAEAWWEPESAEKPHVMSSRSESRLDQGCGFQFWRCRHGAYRGDGKYGQFCIVLPEQDAVVAITANTRDMQSELNVVWDKLLSEFGDKPQAENPDEKARLKATIANLKASR